MSESTDPQELVGLSGSCNPPRPVAAPRVPRQQRVKTVYRSQLCWRLLDVERLIEPDHPVRAIWELSGRLNLKGFYAPIKALEGEAGRTPWDPRLLVSLWVYAYSRGISSAREITRRCSHEPAFQWLCGLAEINHHTLSDFRVNHEESLKELFVEVLGILSAEGWITLERVMQDGTKIKALATKSSFCQEEQLQEHLAAARQQVEAMGDPRVEQTPVQRAAHQRVLRERQQRLEQALEQLSQLRQSKKPEQAKRARVSTSDPEARIMKQADGGFAPSYNMQLSTDAAHKLIVGVSVSQSGNDFGQLVPAMEQVHKTLEKKPTQVVADGGFTSRGNILAMAAAGMDFYGLLSEPNPDVAGQLARRGVSKEFYTSAFVYDAQADTYCCPAGKKLHHIKRTERSDVIEHSYQAQRGVCPVCRFRESCCGQSRNQGRTIVRQEQLAEVEVFRQKMQTQEATEIYKQRSAVAEFPNAWIKAKLGLRQFRLRGLLKVGLEALWASLTYNIQQWIRLSWCQKFSGSA